MNKRYFYALLPLVALLVVAAAQKANTIWFNEAMDANFRKEHAGYVKTTNDNQHLIAPVGPAAVSLKVQLSDSNTIELGFRDDGVVVWRKVKQD